MVTASDIRQLPRQEKLKVMELLWADLSAEDADLDSPSWHADRLRETEGRVAEGNEKPLDWEDAKEILRTERK